MLTENEIIEALAEHLREDGYRVDKQLTTLEQGIDIDAVHLATGRRLLVEAKGGTSSKDGTARFGNLPVLRSVFRIINLSAFMHLSAVCFVGRV